MSWYVMVQYVSVCQCLYVSVCQCMSVLCQCLYVMVQYVMVQYVSACQCFVSACMLVYYVGACCHAWVYSVGCYLALPSSMRSFGPLSLCGREGQAIGYRTGDTSCTSFYLLLPPYTPYLLPPYTPYLLPPYTPYLLPSTFSLSSTPCLLPPSTKWRQLRHRQGEWVCPVFDQERNRIEHLFTCSPVPLFTLTTYNDSSSPHLLSLPAPAPALGSFSRRIIGANELELQHDCTQLKLECLRKSRFCKKWKVERGLWKRGLFKVPFFVELAGFISQRKVHFLVPFGEKVTL